MKILFVCTANKDRSRTAHHLFEKEKPQHEYASCGISESFTSALGTTFITKELCEWADLIICMEQDHANYITAEMGEKFKSKIRVIHLADTETYMSPRLVEMLKERLNFI
ncbi:MAG: hypothetical protein ACE5DN_03090 [Flavobacteriales bacterium]